MLDFFGIGAQKAGTTWLYEMLAQHPQVRFFLVLTHQGKHTGVTHPRRVSPKRRAELLALYADKITRLEALLGEDFSAWR